MLTYGSSAVMAVCVLVTAPHFCGAFCFAHLSQFSGKSATSGSVSGGTCYGLGAKVLQVKPVQGQTTLK